MLYRLSLPGPQPMVFQNEEDLVLFRDRGLITINPIIVVRGSGVDLMEFHNTPVLQKDPTTFLLIARLLKDKGVREFVEAARMLRIDYPQVRFQLLGPLGVANRTAISVKQVANWVDEGVVDYLGSTDDVRSFIEKAHCIVLPSYREGMPRALLEAAAMGRPLIATDVTGCREVVRHGFNGYLCLPQQATDLACKMRMFMHLSYKDRQEMGEASRVMAEKFDVRKVVEAYLRLIDMELAKKSAS